MAEIIETAPMEHLVFAGFIKDTAVFADASGIIRLVDDEVRDIQAHDGLLCAEKSFDEKNLVTSGEDGKIITTDEGGTCALLAEEKGKWIDRLACGPNGAVAWANGKLAKVLLADGTLREIECKRSIEALAFAPKGMRLALARYNGVDLVWVNTNNAPQSFEWKGAHIAVTFSPDGKYLVTSMQENALHGWRLTDQKDMRMSGYPSKVKSLSWSPKNKWLATSGAPAAIVWPFVGKDGPMGKAPTELGSIGTSQVTAVCCNPKKEELAIGFSDGMILTASILDGKITPFRRAGNGEITAMGWDASGNRLAYGSSQGDCGVISQ